MPDPIGLLQALTHAIEDARADVVSHLWEMADGVRLTSSEEMMRWMSELTVLDDIFQDLMVNFVPLRFLHDDNQFYAALARDLARWNARGHELEHGNCQQGKDHQGPGDVGKTIHHAQGQTYIRWSIQLTEMVTQYMGGQVA